MQRYDQTVRRQIVQKDEEHVSEVLDARSVCVAVKQVRDGLGETERSGDLVIVGLCSFCLDADMRSFSVGGSVVPYVEFDG